MDTRIKVNDGLGKFTCRHVEPERAVPTLATDARNGLLVPPRSLPPKYFYDTYGSQLFDLICDTPEYYLTRTEDALLEAKAVDIIAKSRPDHIFELGSGASRKTRRLLDVCERNYRLCSYWPFDVCESVLRVAGEQLVRDYQGLNVNALIGDYHAGLKYLPNPQGRKLFAFLGSTIGNFDPVHAREFLAELSHHMGPEDTLLLGADRVKDEDVLLAAYNDSQGITAEFNLNVLRVLNRELKANFDVQAYRHLARYDDEHQQIEMYLVSSVPQTVELGELGEEITLMRHEPIQTEISRKFTQSDLQDLLEQAGFSIIAQYEPQNQYFSLLLANPK